MQGGAILNNSVRPNSREPRFSQGGGYYSAASYINYMDSVLIMGNRAGNVRAP